MRLWHALQGMPRALYGHAHRMPAQARRPDPLRPVLLADGKLLKVALVACMRRLLTTLNAWSKPTNPGTNRFTSLDFKDGNSEPLHQQHCTGNEN